MGILAIGGDVSQKLVKTDQRYHKISNTCKNFQKKSPKFPIYFSNFEYQEIFFGFLSSNVGTSFFTKFPPTYDQIFFDHGFKFQIFINQKVGIPFSWLSESVENDPFPVGKGPPTSPLCSEERGGGDGSQQVVKTDQRYHKISNGCKILRKILK